MSQNRPQYQPTPELQQLVDAIAPIVRKAINMPNGDVVLSCFSTYPEDKAKLTFYLNVEEKVYKAEIEQKLVDGNATVKLLQLAELLSQ
jgi:hypothetical protein